MIQFLQKLRAFLSPPISRIKAVRIAHKACTPSINDFTVYSEKPENCNIFNFPTDAPCWFVYGPWNDGADGTMLRSSRVIVISRQTGEVLYNGSANDEG